MSERMSFCPIFAIMVTSLAVVTAASAEIQFDEGQWRLELSGGTGVHSGSTDRSSNLLVQAAVEYEFPATPRCTLGLRLLPIFVYDQEDDLETDAWRDHDRYKGDRVCGAGFGVTGRVYQVKEKYRGFFTEAEVLAVAHKDLIDGNSSKLNFLTGVGVGYKCKADWHVVFKYEHISNASLGRHNAGANSLGIGIGYTF